MSMADPRSRTALLEGEARDLRRRLDELLGELDRRRRASVGLLRLRASSRIVLVGAILAAAGGLSALGLARRRSVRFWRRQGLTPRTRGLARGSLSTLSRWLPS